MNIIWTFLKGIAIGIANIIPGVSGGTMALVMGIYERLIDSLHNISMETLKVVFQVVTFRPGWRQALAEEIRRIDAWFLVTLGGGAVTAVVASAKLITYLLEDLHDPTYGFFFGLVLVSVLVPIRMMKKFGAIVLVWAVIACVLTVGVGMSMTADERLAAEQQKLEIKQAKEASGEVETEGGYTMDPVKLLMFSAAGAVAISAMILPGISGSFLLLVMGIYFELLAAIIGLDLPLIGAFSLGCGVGLLAFTRLLHLLLHRFHDPTMGFLLGLMIGSLYTLWPFKFSAMVGDETIYLANRLPEAFGSGEWLTVASFAAGCVIVTIFIMLEPKDNTAKL